MAGPFSKDDMRRIALSERARVRRTLAGLTDEQWATPSLCDGWTVHDVAAHLAHNARVGTLGFLAGMARTGFKHDQYNIRSTAQWAKLPRSQILRALEGDQLMLIFKMNPFLLVVDYVVHQQDIGRPLGLRSDVPPEHLLAALQAVTTESMFAEDAKRAAGLRLVATDLPWSYGDGPAEVRGPAEPLLMALMGRTIGPTELAGFGAGEGRA
jgi:uncharacterized protein (TIGR03083 family)